MAAFNDKVPVCLFYIIKNQKTTLQFQTFWGNRDGIVDCMLIANPIMFTIKLHSEPQYDSKFFEC